MWEKWPGITGRDPSKSPGASTKIALCPKFHKSGATSKIYAYGEEY